MVRVTEQDRTRRGTPATRTADAIGPAALRRSSSLPDRRLLILPSETRNREFDAKLLLACFAAERGFRVIVGSKRDIHLRLGRFPPATYVAKDLRFRSKRIFRILKRLGHRIVAWDEEALVVYSPEFYLKSRIDPECLGQADMLFAWGEANRTTWHSLPDLRRTPIHMTGNPRFDLLRPELRSLFDEEVARLRERFGRFVLVNSNFGKVNMYLPNQSLTAAAGGDMAPEEARAWDGSRVAYRRRLFLEFLAATRRLAENLPGHRIVVRPHPAESHAPWLAALARCSNAAVVHEGNVVPWILASEAMVHNGCTTAIEAAILGRLPIAYRPFASDLDDIPLTNDVSRQALSFAELERAVLAALEAGGRAIGGEGRGSPLLGRHVAALNGPMASERIVEILATDAPDAAPAGGGYFRLGGRCGALAWSLHRRLSARIPGHRNHRSYLAHIFPPLDVADVESRVDRLRRCLDRFANVEIRRLATNIFELSGGPADAASAAQTADAAGEYAT